MLTPYQQPRFLSRVFTDACGRQFRLTFFVAVVDGEVRGRLISAEPISPAVARIEGQVSDGSFCLPIACSHKEPSTEYVPAFAPAVSPYYSAFEFLIHSQPTRAPSLA